MNAGNTVKNHMFCKVSDVRFQFSCVPALARCHLCRFFKFYVTKLQQKYGTQKKTTEKRQDWDF